MAVERRVTEVAGPVGGKLHTARSRNDQVATDVALFTREAAAGGDRGRRGAHAARSSRPPRRHLDWPLPGYTHLQRAQPVYLSHHLLAYVWMLAARPRAAALHAWPRRRRCRSAPARWPGVNFATDRRMVADELGFERVAPNSIDAVANRDFVLDYLARGGDLRDAPLPAGRRARAVVQRGVRVRRAARRVVERLVDHAPEEEPRRRRAPAGQGAARRRPPRRAARRPARAAADLQQGPAGGQGAPLRRRRHARADACAAAAGMVAGARFDRERLAAAASDELIAATDLADLLVAPRHAVPRGPRRRGRARPRGRRRAGAPLSDVAVPALGEEAAEVLRQRSWLESKVSEGGTALAARPRAARRGARAARWLTRSCRWTSTTARCCEVARDLVGCTVDARRTARRHRRDRGLPLDRAGLPRLRRR